MCNRTSRRLAAVAVVCGLLALGGCATRAADVVANPDAYLASNFTLGQLSPALVARLKDTGAGVPKSFTEVTVKFDHYYKRLGAKDESLTHPQVTVRPLGDGFFQELRLLENNGYAVSRNFVLTWAGLLTLRRDEIAGGSPFPVPQGEVKAVKPFRFDTAQLKPGAKVDVDYEIGARPQAFNLRSMQNRCTVLKRAGAAELHPRIKGQAAWLECQTTNDNKEGSKSGAVFLEHYGFALALTYADSTLSTREVIADFVEK